MHVQRTQKGFQYGCAAAEGFRAWRTSGYMPDFKVLP